MTEPILPENTGSTNTASTSEVKNDATGETPDYLALLKAKDEKIAQIERDKENYRKGMLKYKGKSQSDDTEDEPSDEDKMRQIAQEVLMGSELSKAVHEKEELIKKMALENKELKTVIQNKAQVSQAPGGSSQETATGEVGKVGIWTKEQLEYFKSKGIDPNKVAQNWQKKREN